MIPPLLYTGGDDGLGTIFSAWRSRAAARFAGPPARDAADPRLIHGQQQVDQGQDDQLKALREENAELKLYVTALVRLLTRKGVVSEEEVKEMVQSVEGTG